MPTRYHGPDERSRRLEIFHEPLLLRAARGLELERAQFHALEALFLPEGKSKVLTQLPDKVRQIVTCEITNRKEYQDAERDLVDYLRRYKEADDEKVQKSLKGEVMVRIGILKDITARGKLREVIDFVKDFGRTERRSSSSVTCMRS